MQKNNNKIKNPSFQRLSRGLEWNLQFDLIKKTPTVPSSLMLPQHPSFNTEARCVSGELGVFLAWLFGLSSVASLLLSA